MPRMAAPTASIFFVTSRYAGATITGFPNLKIARASSVCYNGASPPSTSLTSTYPKRFQWNPLLTSPYHRNFSHLAGGDRPRHIVVASQLPTPPPLHSALTKSSFPALLALNIIFLAESDRLRCRRCSSADAPFPTNIPNCSDAPIKD